MVLALLAWAIFAALLAPTAELCATPRGQATSRLKVVRSPLCATLHRATAREVKIPSRLRARRRRARRAAKVLRVSPHYATDGTRSRLRAVTMLDTDDGGPQDLETWRTPERAVVLVPRGWLDTERTWWALFLDARGRVVAHRTARGREG